MFVVGRKETVVGVKSRKCGGCGGNWNERGVGQASGIGMAWEGAGTQWPNMDVEVDEKNLVLDQGEKEGPGERFHSSQSTIHSAPALALAALAAAAAGSRNWGLWYPLHST